MKKQLIMFLLFSQFLFGQNIEKHQWKNRVLLVFSDDKKSDKLQQQIEVLSKEKQGLLERKIEIYSFTKEEIRINFEENWIKSNQLFKKYVTNKKDFQVLLIGLDGGIKLTENNLLSTEKLFAIIDGMPMRKRELKNNN